MKFLRYALSASLLVAYPRTAVSFVPSSLSNNHRNAIRVQLFGSDTSNTQKYPVMAEESVMSKKAHGTSDRPVQSQLRWKCDFETADRICNFNRHYAEYAGYWTTTDFLPTVQAEYQEGLSPPIQFYDSVTGALLFAAPVGRTLAEFLAESQKHGWPSFRDAETNWDTVRVLKDGECVSITGTHLGHNLPDGSGKNRYCINLVSVAGQAPTTD